ncbi:tol-pal system protein YbgF [Duganella sp. FT3S]|uniref:Cell division coordinator CpoB n=1 Tax=Rugamonas fusca TaxID=2758568 RepID=A0A7W2I7B6_9BURK|nr:tol-pal system protein YbgF [Rugamonas fusca]MBA5606274.1 tol-pal system protein YbgF [Rugamonas fusca]
MMKPTKSSLAAALLAAFAFLPLHAGAGVFDDDEARKAILDLRTKVDALAQTLNARIDTKSDKSSTLDLVSQNELTAQEIAKLRGQIEVLANELANAQKRQKDFYVDLDARLRKLEPHEVTIDGKAAQVDPNEQKTYEAAMQLFKSGDYKMAGAALAEFVHRYPESGYAANAQYWLGNAYYAQRDCKNAIAAQMVVLKSYADSPKAADAMLNIASCQTELKDKAAKKTLQELIKQYPDSSAAATAKERLKGK